jgi:hypothetical protein
MVRLIQLSANDLEKVSPGDSLIYRIGENQTYFEAGVTVIRVRKSGCEFKIEKAIKQGSQCFMNVGDRIVARWENLSVKVY